PGKAYAVAEENAEVPGYTLVSATLTTEESGLTIKDMGFTLSADSTEIPVLTLTNSYAQGGLTVKKTIGGNASDENDVFTFTVTLTDKDGKPVSGTFDTHTFVDGKYSFTLKGGESENFADLPIGVTYTVTEAPALGYVQTAPTEPATGVISTEAAVVSFTNVRDVVRLVKVTDPTGLTVAPKVTVSGSDGFVVTAEALTANNAAKYLEIPVKPGVTYTVSESGQEVAGYSFVGSELTAKDAEVTVSGMTFTVAKNGMTTIPVLTLSNSYTLDSVTVTIRKVSTGLTEGIAYPAPKVSIYAANSTAPVWTGTLTPNGSALPVKLLPGAYTVKEAIDEVEGYGFTSVLYVNDAASADKTFTLAANAVNTELRLDNFYAAEFSTLTLTKTVKGESGSKTSFSFRITLTDDKGQPITERFPYSGTMDGAAPLNGVITSGSTVALRDGGSITVQLPLGVHYEVEEQEQEGYVLVSSEGEKGVIEKDGAKAAFVNKPQYTATVTKVWESDTADVRPASVQVQLMLNGKPVGDPVTLNAANGWKHTYTGLDAKGPYTVDELTVAEGYVSAVEEGEGNTFVITNSYIVIPPTGDAAHPALYLLALAGSAALLMLLRKRKAA
ncbi:MAG: Cna B-type domain-containing protein, partial [Clostridia bacterium]|nr:Cna B-type domain-containing protein [Clostridia bacterium]